jgi:hypothetical protein
MDVVYICRPGENEELRYSIRSVVKNLKHDNIWVVGSKPSWYTGNFIEVGGNFNKVKSAKNNLKTICYSPDISNEFILMNDDFFVMERIEEFDKNYYQGTLLEKAEYYDQISPNSIYTRFLWETYEFLKKRGYSNPLNFEQHVPIRMHKNGLLNSVKQKPFYTLHRSIFGNIYNVYPLENMDRDVKVYVTEPEKSFDFRKNTNRFLSSEDQSFPMLLDETLSEHFPDASPYEKY